MHANGDSSANGSSALTPTRRDVLRGLALTASAASFAGVAGRAQAVSSAANDKVRAVLESIVKDTDEIGLQVAAYLDGKLVIDAWTGMADPAAGKPVDGDTLFMLSSTTKGVTATCMHACVEKHKLSYDMPIVDVWPEFGAHGKEKATLRHALTHQTGVPQTPVGYTPEWLSDWDRMCRGIADLAPMFTIGQRTAYHSLNYGYINGEILRRVDGRTIAQFLQQEICKPLGIDGAYLGVPDSELGRVAVLTDGPPAPADYDARMVGEPAGSHVADAFNKRPVIQASIPGSGGLFSARGLARHYAMLANWGELDGVRVLPEARIRAGIELQSYEWDEIYWIRARRALGYRRGIDTGPLASPDAFGHVGGGGSFGYADPARRLGIGFSKNYFAYASGSAVNGGRPPRAPSNVVTEAVFDALEIPRPGTTPERATPR
ncbi:MAG TPA: serine hydrolase domain-containing protein [Gammaproteobacteria bacterium]|nr:serine hydrolase domain-containing protein [Gammaproteobacteria bacterium]